MDHVVLLNPEPFPEEGPLKAQPSGKNELRGPKCAAAVTATSEIHASEVEEGERESGKWVFAAAERN